MIKSFFSFSFSLLVSVFLFSQQYQSVSDSIIKNAMQLSSDKKYEESIKEFDKISNLSPDYLRAQLGKSNAYYSKGGYKESAKILESLSIDSSKDLSFRHDYYTALGNSYDSDGQGEKAIQIYDKALEEFPDSFSLYYNKGVVLVKQNKSKEALEYFEKDVELNPYHARAHAFIGMIAFDNGNLTEGALALTTAILLQPNAIYTTDNILVLDKSLSRKYEVPAAVFNLSDSEGSFESIENILRKQFALNNQYKITSEVVVPTTKQLYALMSELSKEKVSDGFFNRTYVSLMKKIWEDKQFENMTYYMFSGLENDKIQKIVSKKSKNSNEFREWFQKNVFSTVARSAEGNGDESVDVADNMLGRGKLENLKRQGRWVYRYGTGVKGLEAVYTNGELNGEFVSYDENGKVLRKGTYVNGKLDGKEVRYYENGNIKNELEYKGGLEVNQVKTYYYSGGLECVISVKDGARSGQQVCYYPNGNKKSVRNYTDGKLNGEYWEYYPNGDVKEKSSFENGYYNGQKTGYNPNKTLASIDNYAKGYYEGEQKTFFANGDLSARSDISKGNMTKAEYYFGKSKTEEYFYKNGKLDRTRIYFDDKPVIEFNYNGGAYYQSYSLLNEKGEVTSQVKTPPDKEIVIKLNNGDNYTKAKFNKKGEEEGEWITYENGTGNLSVKANYRNGKLEGPYNDYFNNEVLQQEITFKDGKKEGKTHSYYINGKMETEGNYINDLLEGECSYYDESGRLKSRYFFENDEFQGMYLDYSVEGKLYQKQVYRKGELITETLYDREGKEVYTVDYTTDGKKQVKGIDGGEITEFEIKNGKMEGDYVAKDKNNQVIFKAFYLNGKMFGESVSYYPNGVLYSKLGRFNGKSEGKYIYNDLNGSLIAETEYHEGKEFGTYKRYFNSSKPGSICYEQEMFNDKIHGTQNYYGINGELILKLYYYEDILTGYQKQESQGMSELLPVKKGSVHITGNYKSGKKAYDMTYKSGKLDGDYVVYNEEEKEIIRSKYQDGLIFGTRIINFPDGRPYSSEEFSDGDRNGKLIMYYEDGKKKIEADYLGDSLNGNFIIYDNTGKVSSVKTYYNGDVIEIK